MKWTSSIGAIVALAAMTLPAFEEAYGFKLQRRQLLVLVGGGAGQLKGGRHIRYAELTPMANLLLGMLDRAGVHQERFGDSTDRIDLQPLSI